MQAQKKGKGKAGERLEKAAELLMGCFRVCASDKYEPSSYIGMYTEHISMQFYTVIYFAFFLQSCLCRRHKEMGDVESS